jgi:hypothetical protein
LGLVLIGLGLLVAVAIGWALWSRSRREDDDLGDTGEELTEQELEAQQAQALLTRDRSRYARNYAQDMLNQALEQEHRDGYRLRYERAKSAGLLELQAITDDFHRGVASHGLIDLMIAGGDLDQAEELFAAIDAGVQDSIIHTDPVAYAFLAKRIEGRAAS